MNMIKKLSIVLGLFFALNSQASETKLPYFGAKFEPPAGKAIHGWGQITHGWNTDHPGAKGDIQDYRDYVSEVAPYTPAIVSFYIHPQRENGQAQREGFIKRYRQFASENSWQMAQIGYDFNPEQVLSGKSDTQLALFFNAMRDIGKPVLMRIGWEFNNRGHFDPVGYREGFKYIVNKMREMKVTNIATLWHASAPDLNKLTGMPILEDHHYMDYYPGDEYVDWWSISQFSPKALYSPGSVEFYQNAAKHQKPVFIGESSPWFTSGQGFSFRDPNNLQESLDWFEAYFKVFEQYPQIKGMNIIIVDWQRWNWIWPQIKTGFNNARLDLHSDLATHYKKWISNERFIHSDDFEQTFLSEKKP